MGNDLRFALRNLAQQKTFAVAAVLTLALGVGASTAVFSVVNGVLLRSLPYPDSDKIVTLGTAWRNGTGPAGAVSGPDFRDWQQQASAFASMAWYVGGESGVKVGESGEFAGVYVVTPQFFEVMKARPAAGRLFNEDEQKPNGVHAMLISAAFARVHFGDLNGALGRSVRFANETFHVVGVLEDGFHFPTRRGTRADVWVPESWLGQNGMRSAHNYHAVARLKPSVTPEQAQGEMNVIAARQEQAWPESNKDKVAVVEPLRESVAGATRGTLQLLMAAVGMLLLLSCANVANMLLSRATGRNRELALRAAMGATRWRIVRQLLVESAVLASIAAVAGFGIALYTTDLLVAVAGQNIPRTEEIRVDAAAALFAMACAAAAVFLFGSVPALQASRVDLNHALRQGGQKGVLGGAGSRRLRNALAVAEIALSLALTIGAGLLFRTMNTLLDTDLGFRPERIVVMNTSVAAKDETSVRRANHFYRDLLPQLRALPGVEAAAGVMGLPTGKRSSHGAYEIDGRPNAGTQSELPSAGFRIATPQFFAALRTPLLQGRDFDERDTHDAAPVAIINRTLANREFPRGDAIGSRIKCGLDRPDWMTVVGVVGDIRHDGPMREAKPEIYMPYLQHPWFSDELHVVVRTAGEAGSIASEARKLAAAVNPEASVSFSTMDAFLNHAVSTPRFRSVLMIAFAAIAALLAMAGVYGVMAHGVSQRVSELGLRLALGADRRDILTMVLRQALLVAFAGLGAGGALAFACTRFMQSMLFGVQPFDLLTYAAAATGIAAMALLAALVPSLRASRVDPVEALRSE